MNLLNISIIMSCNKSCSYCPVSRWLTPVDSETYKKPQSVGSIDYGNNCITNDVLLKWMDKYIDPNEFIVEITGGEPALYHEIEGLIAALNTRSYYGVIKTNGTIPLPKSEKLQRIVSWHEWQDKCPTDYDQILIIRNPREDWRAKVNYCENHNIPCKTSLFDDYRMTGKPSNRSLGKNTAFLNLAHVNNQGQVLGCPKKDPDPRKTIFNDTPPEIMPLRQICPNCCIPLDVEKFLPDWLQKKCAEDCERLANGY